MCMPSSDSATALGGDAKEGSQDLRPGCDAPRSRVKRSAMDTALESKRGSLPLRCCDAPRDSCSTVAAATCTEDHSFWSTDEPCISALQMGIACLKHGEQGGLVCEMLMHYSSHMHASMQASGAA